VAPASRGQCCAASRRIWCIRPALLAVAPPIRYTLGMNPAEFISKWRKVELTERAAAQQHFLDLCALIDHPTPAALDPTGDSFTFERGASKQAGGDGWADVWKRGFFAIEYKGKHKDLAAAYAQLLQYREDLENPPLLVTCDMDRIVIRTNFTATPTRKIEMRLDDMGTPGNIETLRAMFHDPLKLKPGITNEAITTKAASHIADLAQVLRERGVDPHHVALFLDRIVFCLFAEDIDLLPTGLFSNIVAKTRKEPDRFAKLVGQLFTAMAHGGDFGTAVIRHFNGNLFNDTSVLALTTDELDQIHAVCTLDWSAVDPSIFGTLFVRGMDPSKRSQLGAEYTSREDIETIVEPVVFQPLRREWATLKTTITSLLTAGRKVAPASRGQNCATEVPASRGQNTAETTTLRTRGYLPHLEKTASTYHVIFHLADSLPHAILEQFQAERLDIVRTAEQLKRPLSYAEEKRLAQLYSDKIETYLDAGAGESHFRNNACADIVAQALRSFDGQRYELHAWAVMPNHVHVIVRPLPPHTLADILHSWKSYSAHKINTMLGRSGTLWQKEYYDHLIRDENAYANACEYVCVNPTKAGLKNWKWVARCSAGVPPAESLHSSAGVPPAESLHSNAGVPPAESLRNAGGTPALRVARKARGEAASLAHQFLLKLAQVKVLDPACGSGNFLYVTLQKLKDLEKEAILFAMDNDLGGFLPQVGPGQLYGIEIDPYAFDLAQMTVWIGYLQWTKANGFGITQEPILRPMECNFKRMDAILDLNDPANPREPEWPKVDCIVGNPPFLGGKLLRSQLGDEYVDKLFTQWSDRVPHEADLCCYWFEKARQHTTDGQCLRAGLLATQGIRGGANREVLKRIKKTGEIFFAESDRPWILDGANVHVSMIGFDNGDESSRILDGKAVATVNANLTANADTTQARILKENKGIAFMGDTKVGPFEVAEDLARSWLPLRNPHGRSNAEVVRPWANGLEITRVPQHLWIVDFPPGMSEGDAAQFEAPFEYIKQHVKPMRASNKRAIYAQRWWIHGEARPEVRATCLTLPRYLATPRVSKHRLFVWLEGFVLPDCALIVFARADDYFFGVLHSRVHEVWSLMLGTQLETRPRYTPTTCFETFPLPPEVAPASRRLDSPRDAGATTAHESPRDAGATTAHESPRDAGATAIADAAHKLDQARVNWLGDRTDNTRTLTALYNKKPTWLTDLHRALDAAVFAEYGWSPDLTDEQVLERLLALNHERAGARCH